MRILSLVLALLLSACHSVSLKEKTASEPFYSESHLELAKWKRISDCCTAVGPKFAIASGGNLASQAGREIQEKGGNIVDVAVATAFVLAVEVPHSAGLGGGGFLTLRLSGKNAATEFVDFRETAPRKAKKDLYLDYQGQVIKAKIQDGVLSAAVPGFVAGLYDVHQKYGHLPWAAVVRPAAKIAEEGFPVYVELAQVIAENAERIKLDGYTKSLLFNKEGQPLRVGETFKQRDLAATLRLIAEGGKKVFYSGSIADKIVAFMEKQEGVIDKDDLQNYVVKWRDPVQSTWKNFTIVSAPPPSAGGALITEMLNVLEGYPLSEQVFQTASYLHLLSQVMKRGYADRAEYIGDPDFFKEPYSFLLQKGYAETLRKQINVDSNTPSTDIRPRILASPEDHGTTHLSVMDNQGNAAALTMTINWEFGSGLAIPGTGIFLNDEMDDFSVKAGATNLFGLTGGDANSIAPGKRPVSSMSPTIVLQNGKPVLVVGGAGGSRIISSVLQVMLNYFVAFPGDVRRAVWAPRVHHQWLPDTLTLDTSFPEEVQKDLRGRGHEVVAPEFAARVQAVGMGPDGLLHAAFDPRDSGGAEAR